MEKKKINDDMRVLLRAPFEDKAYKPHPTKTFLTTLKAMYVTERLNDVFGIGRWTILTEVAERTNDYVLVKGKFESLDYEVIVPDQYGGHSTTGTNVEIADGFKSAVTDCQSKISSYLEIGIEMFKGNIIINGKSSNKTDDTPLKELTANEVNVKWNGKIYGKNGVFIDNVKYSVSDEQLNKLKAHDKYKPQEKS